jgi:hypothetical protein
MLPPVRHPGGHPAPGPGRRCSVLGASRQSRSGAQVEMDRLQSFPRAGASVLPCFVHAHHDPAPRPFWTTLPVAHTFPAAGPALAQGSPCECGGRCQSSRGRRTTSGLELGTCSAITPLPACSPVPHLGQGFAGQIATIRERSRPAARGESPLSARTSGDT